MVLVVDTETTGNEPPEVIELAAGQLNVTTLELAMPTVWRFKPAAASAWGALAVHHILTEELDECPPSTAARLPAGTQYILGHNIDYDWEALGKPPVKRICTLAMARALYPSDSHSLGAMVYRLHPDKAEAREMLHHAHSAMADIELCTLVLKAMALEHGLSWGNPEALWSFSEQCRIPKIMTVGKHKGLAVKNLPWDYVAWCRRQPDMDPYFIKALKEHFK